jgi:RNA polymerase sigma-70 factor (ECF subfamily)
MDDDVRWLLEKRRYDEALERLLDVYERKVFRMAFVMLRDRGRAEEVTQDIFLKLWRALPAYDGRAAMNTWLYTIARNTCLTALRAESYRRTAALDETAGSCTANPAPVNIAIEQCVARLPDVQREVIMLYYFQDRDVAEVAAMLDLPEGTVKSHLHRARRALGAMME